MIVTFNRHFAVRLFLMVLNVFCVFCLAACVAAQNGGGQELPTQREHNAFKSMILAQPEFTESELLKFREDLAATVDMHKEEVMDYLESVKGWPKNRSTYMILKMGLASESIAAGKSYAALFPIIPAELYPSQTETALVRQHQGLVIPLFMSKNGQIVSVETPAQQPE